MWVIPLDDLNLIVIVDFVWFIKFHGLALLKNVLYAYMLGIIIAKEMNLLKNSLIQKTVLSGKEGNLRGKEKKFKELQKPENTQIS